MQSHFLKTALEAARQSEEIIMKYFGGTLVVETKENQTPVTVADKKAEEKIREIILTEFPNHGFLGEETGGKSVTNEYVWIIDPIDGTKNFIRNIPLFGTQIALMKNGEYILGVSNIPALGECLYAEKGGGVFLNGQKVQALAHKTVQESFVCFGGVKQFLKKGFQKPLLEILEIAYQGRGFGDCYMYNLLGSGRSSVVLEAEISIWDIAAGVAIVEEAGGKVTDMQGRSITVESTSVVAACTPELHQKIIESFVSTR